MLLCLLGSFTFLGRYLDPLLMLKLSTLTSWQSFNDLRMQSRKEQKFAYDPTVVNNIWRVFTRFAAEVFAQYELTFVVKDLDFLFLNLFQCDQICRNFATLEFFWRLWQILRVNLAFGKILCLISNAIGQIFFAVHGQILKK